MTKRIPRALNGYKGNKKRIVDFICDCIVDYGIDVTTVRTAADLFAGTGTVSEAMMNLFPALKTLHVNDNMFFAYCFLAARFDRRTPQSIQKRLDALNRLPSCHGFVSSRYAGTDHPFYTLRDAGRIDGIRRGIGNAHHADIGSLVNVAMRYANVLGGFNSALSSVHLSKNENLPPLHLEPVPRIDIRSGCTVRLTHADALQLRASKTVDLVYIDPPYTANSSYARDYHVLETIARNDDPEVHGKYAIRNDARPSPFESKGSALGAFQRLLSGLDCRYVCMSYGAYGVVPYADLIDVFERAGFSNIATYSARIPKYLHHIDVERPKVTELLIIATKQGHGQTNARTTHR